MTSQDRPSPVVRLSNLIRILGRIVQDMRKHLSHRFDSRALCILLPVVLSTWVFAALVFATGSLSPAMAQDREPDPQDTRGWSNVVEKALREGTADQALEGVNRAIAAAPDLSQLYLARGSLLFLTGKIDESLPDFD